jgi:hypothetical protein
MSAAPVKKHNRKSKARAVAANGERPKVIPAGRMKPWVPTPEDRQTVANGIAWGLPHEVICERLINPETGLRISIDTLKKYFFFELERGTDLMVEKVAGSLFNNATRLNDTRAAIYLLEAKARWSSKAGGAPPQQTRTGVLVVPADAQSPEAWSNAVAAQRAAVQARIREDEDDAAA